MAVDLSQLNDEQRAPVLDTEGAVLVTAGAGSGKTRLLTYRVAHVIEDLGVAPYNVLALTFTNKAAGEMKDRLDRMGVGDGVWVFTFHALCVRILRKYAEKVGYGSNFTIYDDSEQTSVVKKILKDKELEDEDITPAFILDRISEAKSNGKDPDEYEKTFRFLPNVSVISEIYREYEIRLKKNNAMDYDDLLNNALRLLVSDEEAREYYQNKFRYIFIDEFQDTNTVQYEIARILSAKWGNIFAVGDEDQSIYGWRGANFKNIFNFREDFGGCRTYKLERNYRSSKRIISLANKVIKNNTERLDKNLWTDNADGKPIAFFMAQSDKAEVDYVIENINKLVSFEGYDKKDIAILMRINALSRLFEQKFIQYGVAHKIFGGFKFFDRKEIKDVLAYLKALDNREDEESLLRVINFPRRGIGDATVAQLRNYSYVSDRTLYDVIRNIETNDDLPAAVIKKVLPLSNVLQCLENAVEAEYKPSELTKYLCKVAGIKAVYEDNTDENNEKRMNIRELVRSMEEYEQDNENATLSEYLQSVSLYSDTDEMDDEDYITLATIHSAKGLEYKAVFLVGMEEGIFPSSRCVDEKHKMEEERRLLYVAITRAKERLFITGARERYRFGKDEPALPSRFIKEMGFDIPKPGFNSNYDRGYGYGTGARYNRSYGGGGGAYNAEEFPSYDGPSKRMELDLSAAKKKYSAPAQSATGNLSAGKTGVGAKNIADYKVGVKVKHNRFGTGVVTKVNTEGMASVSVKFDGVGELSLLLAYAPIEIVKE